MSKKKELDYPVDLDNDLEERIFSIINLLHLPQISLLADRQELIPTALEVAFEKMQWLFDDYCVKEDEK